MPTDLYPIVGEAVKMTGLAVAARSRPGVEGGV